MTRRMIKRCIHSNRRFAAMHHSRTLCSDDFRGEHRRQYQRRYRARHAKEMRAYRTAWQARARLDPKYRQRERQAERINRRRRITAERIARGCRGAHAMPAAA